MGVNNDKTAEWKADIARSVDLYNTWFLEFAPTTFRETRIATTEAVEATLYATANLTNLRTEVLKANPQVLATLRMATCPPIARDRLVGLAGVSKNLVNKMERDGVLAPRMSAKNQEKELSKILAVILKLLDHDIFPWLEEEAGQEPDEIEVRRAATIVADRLCGATADPIIRNAQERRQLAKIRAWLRDCGYVEVADDARLGMDDLGPGTFAFRFNVPAEHEGGMTVNIPIDAVIKPLGAEAGELPLLVEAKSAGDFTNVNKRRKEEGKKVEQLRRTHGDNVRFVLFLCGYFDSGYLGYEAAEGIDWVWEHRIGDFEAFGL